MDFVDLIDRMFWGKWKEIYCIIYYFVLVVFLWVIIIKYIIIYLGMKWLFVGKMCLKKCKRVELDIKNFLIYSYKLVEYNGCI